MKLLIVTDAFPPAKTSAAVHMYDLSLELIEQGHSITVIVPIETNEKSLMIDNFNRLRLVSVLAPKTKGIGYFRRALAELILPFVVYYRLKSSIIFNEKFDGIIWYSPTIFWGSLISRLKIKFKCHTYLVLRDMFPDWAVDLGLMKKRTSYYFLKIIELNQYRVANRIGIQSPGNFKYFNGIIFKQIKPKVELLWTWVTPNSTVVKCSIDLEKTHLAGREIFVYAGNMGIAQDFDLIISLVELLRNKKDIGFVFVGRGTEVSRLKAIVKEKALENILFYDEINSSEIPALYEQCRVGLIALDPRHKSNNIPGKFLSYMTSGLPVLARLNHGNDLIDIIESNAVGASYSGSDASEFKDIAINLIHGLKGDQHLYSRCKELANNLFSTKKAAKQIVDALEFKN